MPMPSASASPNCRRSTDATHAVAEHHSAHPHGVQLRRAARPGLMAIDFQHRHAAHCESGVVASLLTHHGLPISEAMVFGISSALAFAYLPMIQLGGLPLISFRMPPKAIIHGVQRALGWRFRFETFREPAAAEARVDQMLARRHTVGMQTSVVLLPYFSEDMRIHVYADKLILYWPHRD